MTRKFSVFLVLAVIAAFMGYAAWKVLLAPSDLPPEGFARGNGRIEADLIDVSARLPGRVKTINVREGDLVKPGDVLAVMDTAELEAQRQRSIAAIASAKAAVAVAQAGVSQAQAKLALAQNEVKRSEELNRKGVVSQEALDIKRTEVESSQAALAAAKANVEAKKRAVDAEKAALQQIETQIADSTLYAPAVGRVLYRLAQPSEVVGSGGKVLTLVSLEDVYMEFFLPATAAARLQIGDDARIVLDVIPNASIPAVVSFVAPQAQFTPKQVETLAERESLMFRVRVRLPSDLVKTHIERVKTGVRGVAWVRLASRAGLPDWPDDLTPPLMDKLPDPATRNTGN